MKQTITFVLLMLICICGYAQSIGPALEKEMGQRKDDEKIRVFVIMKQQYDREQLCRRADYYTTRAERREFVVNELKQFADASQYDIRKSLAEMERNDMVTEPKILWMANAIYFSATKQAIFDLAKRKDVNIIGFDEEVNMIPDGEESKPAPLTRDISITPNVTQVKADQVWSLGYTGQGVVVALIDTGVNYEHLDLKDHLWDGGDEFPHHGWDVGEGDNDPMDYNSHGTHCAGIVCGDGCAGQQTGMAPDVTIMCVKITRGDSITCRTIDECNGIQWAVEHHCDLFSLSFGGHSSVEEKILLRHICDAALDAGVIGSVCAGNEGNKLDNYPIPTNVRFPGGCPPPYMDPVQEGNPGGLSCVVCVGAVDANDQAAYYSSLGPVEWTDSIYGDYPYTPESTTEFGLIRPDVCAPGNSIISADNSNTSGYITKSGTSMATPCVAGCMALMLSKNPELTPADICRILEETAKPLAEGKSNVYGYGRVNALAAVNAVPDNILSLASHVIHDEQGNNNQQLNAGESVTMDMDLRCGPNALDNATLNITCGSKYVTIANGTIALPDFAAGQTQTVTGFAFMVNDEAPVRRKMTFYADVLVDGNSVGHFAFTLAVEGNILVYESACVLNDDNGNGFLEPGETADLRVFINNTGNATAQDVTGTLSTGSEYLTINSTDMSFGNVAVYEPAYADFSVTLSASATDAFPMPCTLNLVDAENQMSGGVEFSLFNITTTANPQGAGTLTGAGTYGTGTKVKLSTVPDDNHTLIGWEKDNTVLSYYNDCDIVVTENLDYVANFNALGNVVSVGQAISHSNVFPTISHYNYSLSQQIFTTEDLGEAFDISSIAFFSTGTLETRNCRIYLKHTEKSAFQNKQDWIAIAPEDLLFEGDITFTVGAWNTVYFDHAFAYDGIHNVVLVVDDNTGSNHQGLACRAYYPEGVHAIRIYGNSTNYDPYDPSIYADTAIIRKNQVLFGIANYDYTVTVSAEPSDGGTVSVSEGPFFYGQPCTATATPSGDNVFYYWSENGTIVSTDAAYSFRVEASRNLIARFGPPVNVTVSAEPEEGGTVGEEGTLGIGQPLTITATANEGYVFDKWTLENSLVAYTSTYNLNVSGEAEYVAHFKPSAHGTVAVGQAVTTDILLPSCSYYKYSLTQQIYTPEEIGGACHIGSIAFFNTGYEETRSYTIYMVPTDKTAFGSNTDWIVPTAEQQVFSGEVTMVNGDWTTITFDTEFDYDGTSNLALIVDDNTGNCTDNHMSCRVYNANDTQAISIYNDDIDYDPSSPSDYSGTIMTVKNQIVLGLSSFHFTTDGNWNTASNWQLRAIPNGSDAAFIDANCQLDTDAEVMSMTITEGQSMTIPEGQILTVTGTLTNATTSSLIIEDGGQLVHGNEGVQATVQKDIAPYTTDKNGWYLIAPPLVGNTAIAAVDNMLSDVYDLYYYDEPTHYWRNQKSAANNFTELEHGKGYLYANNGEVTLKFVGELQDGSSTVTIPLSYTESSLLRGFNLVGNPFVYNVTSYTSTNVADGCFVINETKDDLVVGEISEANPLKPAEGFFVKATGEGASITFSPGRGTMTHQNGSIRVELSDHDKLVDRIIVKSDGQKLEKLFLNEQRTKLFVQDEQQEWAIVPCKGNEQPVSFKAVKNGTYTINVNTSNMEFDYLHLIDNLTGVDVDLLALRQAQGPMTYTFEAKTTDYASRFRLVFSVIGDASGDDAPFAFINNGDIIIIGAEAGAVLQIVDVLGHVVRSGDAIHCVSTGGMTKGVYVLRLINGDDVKTQKIIID